MTTWKGGSNSEVSPSAVKMILNIYRTNSHLLQMHFCQLFAQNIGNTKIFFALILSIWLKSFSVLMYFYEGIQPEFLYLILYPSGNIFAFSLAPQQQLLKIIRIKGNKVSAKDNWFHSATMHIVPSTECSKKLWFVQISLFCNRFGRKQTFLQHFMWDC